MEKKRFLAAKKNTIRNLFVDSLGSKARGSVEKTKIILMIVVSTAIAFEHLNFLLWYAFTQHKSVSDLKERKQTV